MWSSMVASTDLHSETLPVASLAAFPRWEMGAAASGNARTLHKGGVPVYLED